MSNFIKYLIWRVKGHSEEYHPSPSAENLGHCFLQSCFYMSDFIWQVIYSAGVKDGVWGKKSTWGRSLLGICRNEQVATPISTLLVSHRLAWPTLPMQCTLLGTCWDDPAVLYWENACGVTIFLRQHWPGMWPYGSRPGSGIATQTEVTALSPGAEPHQGWAVVSAQLELLMHSACWAKLHPQNPFGLNTATSFG